MIEIKEATLQDLPGLREVAISSYSDTFAAFNTPENMLAFFNEAYTEAAFEKEYHEPNSRTYLAWDSNKIVGFLRLRECDEVKTILGTTTVELQRLYVLTAAQGKSVGRLLMEKALGWAWEKKYEWIWLGVWEKNFKAQKFYQKWGFEKFSEHVFQMGDDPQIDWLLRKKL
ncbi:MAG: GNAT family N-acetyltransferase [Cyclobacteriaceae bacterium]|jgi:diamine N-acetyltransferase|nr:GNAT family N-acetyltransferase [Cyclobacteriaceae bacterium]